MKNLSFLLAPDSFKGSMTALEVCDAMERGIRKVLPKAECVKVPMADGGEGTMQALVDATGGKIYRQKVMNPIGKTIMAEYGILGDLHTGVVEMASASGLTLLSEKERNPLITSTYGTGELIKACLDRGLRKIILGIGGSATNDGGTGFAKALGVRFLNRGGNELPHGGAALKDLYHIDISGLDRRLKEVVIEVACDVTNPLCGKQGASYVYGKQKGATEEMMTQLDDALLHYSDVVRKEFNRDINSIAGAGAAGGLGAALLAFTNARLQKGFDIMVDYTGLKEKVKQVTIVFTGEGKIDFQTQFGKTPLGVAQVALSENKRVIAFAGAVDENIAELYSLGFDAIFSIVPQAMNLDYALLSGQQNIERTVENVVRLLNINL